MSLYDEQSIQAGSSALYITMDSFEGDVRVHELTEAEHRHLAECVLTAALPRSSDVRQMLREIDGLLDDLKVFPENPLRVRITTAITSQKGEPHG